MVDDTNEITHVPPESQAESALGRDLALALQAQPADIQQFPDGVDLATACRSALIRLMDIKEDEGIDSPRTIAKLRIALASSPVGG
jgi:hypothetical protein